MGDTPRNDGEAGDELLGYGLRELTFANVLALQAARFPDKLYFHSLADGRKLSFADADRLTSRIASGLVARGIGPGTTVALYMENSTDCLLLHLALGKLGAIGAPVNAGARGQLLKHFIALSGATCVVADGELVGRYIEIEAEVAHVNDLVVVGSAEVATKARAQVHAWRNIADAEPRPLKPVRFDAPAHILFTSGTTGPSKGVLYVQARSLVYGIDQARSKNYGPHDVIYGWNPLFHVGGLQCVALAALVSGATVVMPKRFSVSRFWQDVRDCGATVTSLTGATIAMMWAQPPADTDRKHKVRLVITSPMPSFAHGFRERFGVAIGSGYGLSDCGMATYVGDDDPFPKQLSAGRPLPGWELRVVDEDDIPLPPGETGEILMRCNRPWSMGSGYHGNDTATVDAWRNGWFHSGDRGYLDADGYLWFVGRKKDAIRRRGENISAYEVELAITSHPAVAEAAAFALPSELEDEEVAVCVLLKKDAELGYDALMEHCRTSMARFMLPRYLRIVAELPKNLSQKVEKYKLREEAVHNRGLYRDFGDRVTRA